MAKPLEFPPRAAAQRGEEGEAPAANAGERGDAAAAIGDLGAPAPAPASADAA